MEIRPARGFRHHAEAAGPLDGFGPAGGAGGVEEHTGVFGDAVRAVCEGGCAGLEGGVLDVRYVEGVEGENGIGVVVVAEDCGVGGFGGVVLKGRGDRREELVGGYDEVRVGYGEAVFQRGGGEGGVDGGWDGAYLPESEDGDHEFGGVVDYHCYHVAALDVHLGEFALHFRYVRH